MKKTHVKRIAGILITFLAAVLMSINNSVTADNRIPPLIIIALFCIGVGLIPFRHKRKEEEPHN